MPSSVSFSSRHETPLAPPSAADQDALQHVQSAPLEEIRAMNRMMNAITGLRESSIVTDGEMEEYRRNLIHDLLVSCEVKAQTFWPILLMRRRSSKPKVHSGTRFPLRPRISSDQ